MDPLPVEFHPDAISEACSTREWYHERSANTAMAFMAELDDAVEQIAQAPERWASFIHGTRHYLFRRFPYVLVYRQTTQSIHVVAVAHAKRRPGYWKDRLSE